VRILESKEHAPAVDSGRAIGWPSALLHVSIVCAIDGARFAAVAASEQECLAQVVSYIAAQAG
jgi:hypothetical protein